MQPPRAVVPQKDQQPDVDRAPRRGCRGPSPCMTAAELKGRLLAGRTVFGTLIVSTSPKLPENAAKVGFDFVFIDTEHIAIDRDTLSWMCLAYRGLGLPPIVRVPAPDPYLACMALDGGAAGIIAPYVET